MRYFCTYFDRNFVYQGLALYESLCDHAGDFTLWVLCFDETTFVLLSRLNLPHLRTIRLEDFEAANPALISVKADRSFLEYYWTSTPLLLLYVLNLQPDVDLIAYLDADLFFYSKVSPIYEEFKSGSIYIIPHQFEHGVSPDCHEFSDPPAGRYNVGYVAFRREDIAISCLERWGRQCLDWCYLREENGKMGDQKYLDDWPGKFPNVIVSENHGVGAGGWNLIKYRISKRNGLLYLDDVPLVMLHLNFIDILSSRCFTGTARWYLRPVYRPYARALRVSIRRIRQVAPNFHPNYATVPYWLFFARLVRGGVVLI